MHYPLSSYASKRGSKSHKQIECRWGSSAVCLGVGEGHDKEQLWLGGGCDTIQKEVFPVDQRSDSTTLK